MESCGHSIFEGWKSTRRFICLTGLPPCGLFSGRKTKGLAKGWTRLLVHKAGFIEYLLGESCSVPQSCLTLGDPMDCRTPGRLLLSPGVYSNSCSLSRWCHPTISFSVIPFSSCLPSIFPSIRVFSSELALRIRWSEYWSFSFSISPSKEYSGLIYWGRHH